MSSFPVELEYEYVEEEEEPGDGGQREINQLQFEPLPKYTDNKKTTATTATKTTRRPSSPRKMPTIPFGTKLNSPTPRPRKQRPSKKPNKKAGIVVWKHTVMHLFFVSWFMIITISLILFKKFESVKLMVRIQLIFWGKNDTHKNMLLN